MPRVARTAIRGRDRPRHTGRRIIRRSERDAAEEIEGLSDGSDDPIPPQLREELAFIIHLAVDVLGYRELQAFHIGWFRELLTNPQLLFLAPRSHFKSTCITVVYAIYRIVRNPAVRILIVNEILDNAKGFLREIKSHLQSQKFRDEFGDMCQNSSKWSEAAITIQSERLSKDPTVAVAGSLGSIVSRHCDLIIVDDPISFKNSQTTLQRQRVSRWFAETLFPILEPDGQMIVTGTRWHFDDLYGEILDPKRYRNWRKIVLKAEWDEMNPETGEIEHHILFPQRFNQKTLRELRENMTEPFYASQYLNDPSRLQGQKFKYDWLAFYDSPPKELRIFQGTDLAISKNDAAAFFACATIGVSPGGDIYLLDYVRERLDFPQQCQMMKAQWRLHKPIMCGIERVGYQGALLQWLANDAEARSMPFVPIATTSDKIAKLTSMSPLFANGVIHVREDQYTFIDEYLAFPRSGTWDLLEAVYFAIDTSRSQETDPIIEEIHL